MTHLATKFLEKALSLSPTERAEVAERILLSLDPSENDLEVETAWQFEIDKRLADIHSGKVTCVSWEDVRARAKVVAGVAH